MQPQQLSIVVPVLIIIPNDSWALRLHSLLFLPLLSCSVPNLRLVQCRLFAISVRLYSVVVLCGASFWWLLLLLLLRQSRRLGKLVQRKVNANGGLAAPFKAALSEPLNEIAFAGATLPNDDHLDETGRVGVVGRGRIVGPLRQRHSARLNGRIGAAVRLLARFDAVLLLLLLPRRAVVVGRVFCGHDYGEEEEE